MNSLHELALQEAERVNPGGEHRVTSIEINGTPDEPGDAVIEVHSVVLADKWFYADEVNIGIEQK